MFSIIIVANGSSNRFGKNNKLLSRIDGEYLINITIDRFLENKLIEEIILVSNNQVFDKVKNKNVVKTFGGETRASSVYNGLKLVTKKYVLVHDGARPFVNKSFIKMLLEEIKNYDVVVPYLKVTSCLKQVFEDNTIKTVNRNEFIQTQTPQVFLSSVIKKAYEKFDANWMDDLQAVENNKSLKIKLIEGDSKNIKITYASDLNL
ncbi:2-C-methyl-D-erythritol 4-phosphate cytidylyltransferase [Spiroplasma corruscae]|uniref:2-C-methyl-D-erythritol 4-phosphate cytidylyltransferase n=1 Tax=Spiroplasma corruscae TaxID=216934 RepID=A0A222ENC1_9MOLU|nr:IspD/TarI family cytidylyltransferase [Spiroplasma corruscae]ASP27794.1 2-C-methyl-D-erythritol 4-phosphate cytidylyltransferase [Spiroplasma corruscae]